jgi:hypothetical protein
MELCPFVICKMKILKLKNTTIPKQSGSDWFVLTPVKLVWVRLVRYVQGCVISLGQTG